MQRYFAVRVDSSGFREGKDWFASEEESQRMFAREEENGPLLYLSSVVYGRALYFGMESNNSEMNIEAEAEGAYDGVGSAQFSANMKLKNLVDNSKINYVAIGGSAKQGAINNYDEFMDLLKEEPDNLSSGGPIAYVVRFVKNDKIAFVNMSTEYTERTCKKISGNLQVKLQHVQNNGSTATCEMRRILCQVVVYQKKDAILDEVRSQDAQIVAAGKFSKVFNRIYGDHLANKAEYMPIGFTEFDFNSGTSWDIDNGDTASGQTLINKFNKTTETLKLFDNPLTRPVTSVTTFTFWSTPISSMKTLTLKMKLLLRVFPGKLTFPTPVLTMTWVAMMVT